MNTTTEAVKESRINAAICRAMAAITRLEKLGFNAFDKYHFTSTDDFKDHLRPILAKEGLSFSMAETAFEILELKNSKDQLKVNCRVQFEFRLYHDSGDDLPPEPATVILPYTGAQTAGIARSYAVKEWLKSRFLASSGDVSEEADMRRQDEFTSVVLSKKDAKPLYEALQRELRATAAENNSDSLLQWALTAREQLIQLPADWREEIRGEYIRTLETVKATEKLDGAP